MSNFEKDCEILSEEQMKKYENSSTSGTSASHLSLGRL